MPKHVLTPLADRLWSKVDRRGDDECWPWTGQWTGKYGYGVLSRGRASWGRVRAHRAAWELTYGPIPDGMMVCHHCDNPPCCNPAHLFLGDALANNRDARAKGRHVHGERALNAKLSENEVILIRGLAGDGILQKDLAYIFGVQKMQVSRIVNRLRWAHVQ